MVQPIDRVVEIDAADIRPSVTWGTNPGMVSSITGAVPDPDEIGDSGVRDAMRRALTYMARMTWKSCSARSRFSGCTAASSSSQSVPEVPGVTAQS